MKRILILMSAVITALTMSSAAFAHVVVQPTTVGVAKYQIFSVGVPNETDDTATTSIRLVVPENVSSVSVNVKPGWTVNTTKAGEGEDAVVSEINWTGGQIPPGQRDDFLFSAKTPATASDITWKVYQTYSDGTVVSWDLAKGQDEDDANHKGPASITTVKDDLVATPTTTATNKVNDFALPVAVAAFVLALIALLKNAASKKLVDKQS